jgi:hypothetical protein
MERQSDCSPLSGPRLHRFGQLNDPGKRLGRGTIVRAGFLLDDEAIELDNPMGWEPLTHEIDC